MTVLQQRSCGRLSDTGRRLNLVHSADPAPFEPVVAPKANPIVSFDRLELTAILNVYGRQVVAGNFRDYALDFLRDRALFSIYKRSSERPLFVVEKNPRLRARQGQYLVTGQDGRVLKRGHDLKSVLSILEPRLSLVGE